MENHNKNNDFRNHNISHDGDEDTDEEELNTTENTANNGNQKKKKDKAHWTESEVINLHNILKGIMFLLCRMSNSDKQWQSRKVETGNKLLVIYKERRRCNAFIVGRKCSIRICIKVHGLLRYDAT